MDLDERTIICSNALEETSGKELQVASDKILSRVIEKLLESCNIDVLCSFLQSCAKHFADIAVDQAGSHVAEAALKSLSNFLHNDDNYAAIERTLTKICQELAVASGKVILNCYGSHVFRNLLCVCKGIQLDASEDFHVTKPVTILAERLSGKSVLLFRNCLIQGHQEFPELFKCLIGGILGYARDNITDLQISSCGTLVLQTLLKLLPRDDPELFSIVPSLLGCNHPSAAKLGEYLETAKVHEILDLLKSTAFSHLMEVILEVAPDTLYDEIFMKVFRTSLLEITSHDCGNFVIQALLSSARHKDQMSLIWEELGAHFKYLLKMRKSGVVACLLTACKRLHTHEKECSRALAIAVLSESEPPNCIVPRLLFLENYFKSEEMTSWTWQPGMKISVLGCLVLQIIFSYPSKFIQPFVTSIISLESGQVLEVAKNAGGGRIIEAFLSSNVSVKWKYKLIAKLDGHFAELALLPSGSFTVEKCFTCGSLSLKELMVSELSYVQVELSQMKHGSHLLKKLDVSRFANRPEQWRSRQASRQSAQKEFSELFGSNGNSEGDIWLKNKRYKKDKRKDCTQNDESDDHARVA